MSRLDLTRRWTADRHYVLAPELVVQVKTTDRPAFQSGTYRVWDDVDYDFGTPARPSRWIGTWSSLSLIVTPSVRQSSS